MQTIKQISWDIVPLEAPLYIKKCSKCKASDHFYCSSKFRMNSQKKNSDVWLIYKCMECDNTFNITILSRIKSHLIEKDMYGKFMNNDSDTALKFAFDQETINRNKVQVEYTSVKYEIKSSPDISLNEMIFLEEDLIEISVSYLFSLNLKLSRIIRERFDISLHTLCDMVELEIIKIDTVENIRKEKVKNNMKILINRHMLSAYLIDKGGQSATLS